MEDKNLKKNTSATILIQQAKLCEEIGNYSQAIDSYLTAIEIKGDASPAWWFVRLAQTYILASNIPFALQAYTNALEINPNNDSIKTAVRELQKWADNGASSIQASPEYYNDIYERSETYRKDGEETSYFQMWKRIIELLSTNRREAILDIGSGPGQFAAFLAKRYHCDYIGLDFSHVAIRQAIEKKLPYTFIQGNALETKLIDNATYDTFICTEVFEHIDQDIELLERVKLGTYCICSVPSFYAFGHVRYFKTIEAVIDRYGFAFENITVELFTLPSTENIFLFHGKKTIKLTAGHGTSNLSSY